MDLDYKDLKNQVSLKSVFLSAKGIILLYLNYIFLTTFFIFLCQKP